MGGTIKLFRFAGIQVYLHFSWFLVAALEISRFAGRYNAPVWAVLEYLSLFFIVLVHEFGHALACRQVGGVANQIVLWPLGGVAFVNPPARPGAYLWSIAAGPLVNVVFVPILSLVWMLATAMDWRMSDPDLYRFVTTIWYMNLSLLIFNLLPIYPLDGGQIVRALLWFKLGLIRSLKVASVIGIAGAVIFGLIAFGVGSLWLGILAAFIFMQATVGWRQAKAMQLAADEAGRVPPPAPAPVP